MQLTKYVHSCVRVDDGDRSLVLDPGAFSDLDAALDGVAAVLITHEHADHVDVERVSAALEKDPRLQLFAPASVAASFDRFGEQVHAVGSGETFQAAGYSVQSFGGQHALIHPAVPMISNIGYVIDGVVAHPGDSFVVPPVPVDTLLLPANAPWSKVSEVLDYAISVRARQALAIHDHLVIDAYRGLLGNLMAGVAAPHGVGFDLFADTVTVASG